MLPELTLNTPQNTEVLAPSGIIKMIYNAQLDHLLALGQDRRVSFWSIPEKRVIKQLQASYEVEVNSFSLTTDGNLIVVGDESGEVKVFTYNNCQLVHIENVHSSGVSAIGVSPDNTLIITADDLGHMFFWRI